MTDKKTAALTPSAPTDDGQLLKKYMGIVSKKEEKSNPNSTKTADELQEYLKKLTRMQDPNYLHTISMEELFDTVYEEKPAIIEGFLYAGAYLFAGAPKVGKSFFMSQLAYHVSTGQPLWEQKVRQGTVLYLALEDDYKRLQNRLYRMFGVETTQELHFAIGAKQLGLGLEEQITKFIQEHKETRLVIIDTLQKVRQIEKENCSYAMDYAMIGILKGLADRHGICILIVHHTRKDESVSGQRFSRISGTNGLFGAADGAFLMEAKVQERHAVTLEVTGRDQPERKLHLKQDIEHLVWQLCEEETDLWKEPPNPLLEKVASILTEEQPIWRGTATELVTQLELDMKPNALSMMLNVKSSVLLQEYHIQYQNTRNHAGRYIELRLQPAQA